MDVSPLAPLVTTGHGEHLRFTFYDPVRRWREWRARQWPGDIGPVIVEGFAEYPPTSVAVTFSASALAKRSGTTPDAIKAVLEKVDGVYY